MRIQDTQVYKDVRRLWEAKRFHDAQEYLDNMASPAERRRIRARELMPTVATDYDKGYARGYHDAREDEV